MQDNQSPQRIHHIIRELEELWQYPHEPSTDDLTKITEFIVSLQEPYKTIGLQKIAEHTISNISLHILAIMALFQQKATEEGISPQNRDETFNQINPKAFQILDELNKHFSINSLDELVALSNITIGLQTLSQVNTASEAQSWLYELPTMYYQQLKQENLVVNATPVRPMVFVGKETPFISPANWLTYDTVYLSQHAGPSYVISSPGASAVPFAVFGSPIEPIEVKVILEPGKKTPSRAA
jgi:hypothetical protein